jgi:DNA polymerase I
VLAAAIYHGAAGLNAENGLPVPSNKLIGALEYFGLDSIGAVHKQNMIDLILRGPP